MPVPLLPAIIAAAVSVAAGVGTMIEQNVNNKNALKNNQTQQAAAVQNAQDATQKAAAQETAWNAANPAPTAGAKVAQPNPTIGAPGSALSGNPIVGKIVQAAQAAQAGAAPASAPSAGSAPNPLAALPGMQQITAAPATQGNAIASTLQKILGAAA